MAREWEQVQQDQRETIEAHQETAPVKLSAIAKALGLRVKASTLDPGISGEIRPDKENEGGYLIRVNRHDSARRQRFTVAHEIAHFLLHREQIGTGVVDDVLYRSKTLSDRREAEANRLASYILMPTTLVQERLSNARAIGVDDVVAYMADQFEVSEAAMKIKLGVK
jgi:Zn-dependent peptidase ImmA (M78 family)